MKEFFDNYFPASMLTRQVILFLLVGGLCYLISILILMVLVEAAFMEVNLANLIASLIAIYAAYILNARFIFQRGKHAPAKEIAVFFLYSFIGLLINVTLMFLLTKYTPIWYVASKTAVTIMVASFNFVTRKFIVFSG